MAKKGNKNQKRPYCHEYSESFLDWAGEGIQVVWNIMKGTLYNPASGPSQVAACNNNSENGNLREHIGHSSASTSETGFINNHNQKDAEKSLKSKYLTQTYKKTGDTT